MKNSRKRFVVLQGGSGAGKTYNTLLALIDIAHENKGAGALFTIVRKTWNALRKSAYKDFIDILIENKLYSTANHNQTNHTYNLFGNTFEFMSLDDPQKARGPRRQVLFCNEANELSIEDFTQLQIRTSEKIIIDFNPTFEFWAFEKLIPKTDICDYYITTYRDNPFLPDAVVQEIENLKNVSEAHYQAFALGVLAPADDIIFTKVQYCDAVPDEAHFVANYLDWGFTADPTAIGAVYLHNHRIYIQELCYQQRMTNDDIAGFLKDKGLDKKETICDSSEPKSIEELRRLGVYAVAAKKGPDSIRASISKLTNYELYVTQDSTNVYKELKQYRWKKDQNGKITKDPVDVFNHHVDGIRYVALNKLYPHTKIVF